MSADNIIAFLSVFATVAVAAAGFVINRRWRKSDQQRISLQRESEARNAVTTILRDLTTGETEEARNLVGTLRYGDFDESKPTRGDIIRAYYRLVWAIERTAAASMAVEKLNQIVDYDARTQQLRWHLVEIVRNVELLSSALVIEDKEAKSRREAVVEQLGVWGGIDNLKSKSTGHSSGFSKNLVELKSRLLSLGIPVNTGAE